MRKRYKPEKQRSIVEQAAAHNIWNNRFGGEISQQSLDWLTQEGVQEEKIRWNRRLQDRQTEIMSLESELSDSEF